MQRDQPQETGPYTTHKKSIQNKDLNVTPEAIKFQKENIGGYLNISLGDDFLDLTTKAKVSKRSNIQTNGTTSN